MDGCLFGSQASGELELAVTGPRVSSRHTAIGGSSKLVGAMLLNFRQLLVHRAQYESEPPVHSTRYLLSIVRSGTGRRCTSDEHAGAGREVPRPSLAASVHTRPIRSGAAVAVDETAAACCA